MTQEEFYLTLVNLLEASQQVYNEFKRNPNYLNATVLKSINISILNYLEAYKGFAEKEHKGDFESLIKHYLGWMKQFEEEENKRNPKDNELFNYVRKPEVLEFPLKFVIKLIKKVRYTDND